MNLFEPFLKKRINGEMPRMNPLIGSIEQHFIIRTKMSFHFGTKNNQLCYYAWKILLTDSDVESEKPDNIINALINCETLPNINNDVSYLTKYGFEYSYIIFNDKVDWKKENNSIAIVTCSFIDDKLSFDVVIKSQKEFQQLIAELNGINLTNKPLIYSTTEFEGYLSDICIPGLRRSDISLFPGDVDLVLFNNKFETVCLVEFKKHTDSGYGILENQSFSNYLSKDFRKYSGLAKLNFGLGKDYFYNVIYSTKASEYNKIKIEKISNSLNLQSSQTFYFANIQELENVFMEQIR